MKYEFYEVYGHTDTMEGRGSTIVVARFMNYDDAEAFVKSKYYANWCVMGYQNFSSDIRHIKSASVYVYESFEEYDNEKSAETLRKRALSKLTDAEIKALGLK